MLDGIQQSANPFGLAHTCLRHDVHLSVKHELFPMIPPHTNRRHVRLVAVDNRGSINGADRRVDRVSYAVRHGAEALGSDILVFEKTSDYAAQVREVRRFVRSCRS